MHTTTSSTAPVAAVQGSGDAAAAAQTAAAAKSAADAAVQRAADVAAGVATTGDPRDGVPSPELVYRGARAARDELRGQLDALVSQRHGFLRELEDHSVQGPATAGMQQRIVQLDGRIAQLDIEIAKADAAVAQAAAVPGAVVAEPEFFRSGPPEEVFFIIPPLLAAVFFPIAIAYARRIWKRSGAPAPAQLPSDLSDRLSRLEAMGETTALEVERIGEGQRFVTRLLTERGERVLADGSPEGQR